MLAARLRAGGRDHGADGSRRLGGERDPDVSRPRRPLEQLPARGARHARGLRARPAARLGVVRVAPAARGRSGAQPRPRGPRRLEPAVSGLHARHAERRRPARARRARRNVIALPRLALGRSRAGTRCPDAPARWREEAIDLPELPPRCPHCGGLARPGVVWFGEPLDPRCCRGRRRGVDCDVFLAVGTSAVVYPAAGLLTEAGRARSPHRRDQPRSDPGVGRRRPGHLAGGPRWCSTA